MKLTKCSNCSTLVNADPQHVDERARHDQITENCAVDWTIVLMDHVFRPSEINADQVAVGESQVADEVVDGIRNESRSAVRIANHFDVRQPVLFRSSPGDRVAKTIRYRKSSN